MRVRSLVPIAGLSFLISAPVASCQQAPSLVREASRESFQIKSAILGESRRIFVTLPASFEKTAAPRTYPVIVVVDGEALTLPVSSVTAHLSGAGQMPESIVIGIENTNRLRDLTPPALDWLGTKSGDTWRGIVDVKLKVSDNFGVKYLLMTLNPAATPDKKRLLGILLDRKIVNAPSINSTISSHGQTIFQRFVQPLIDALDELFLRMLSHGSIVARKQVPWRIQSKQRHRLETFLPKLGRKNAVVGQCMAINFAWCFVRQPPPARLIAAEIHLFVAFVAVKGPAPCLSQLIFLRL